MFLSKIKDLTRFNKKPKMPIDITFLQNQLSGGLFNVMEKSFQSRQIDTNNSTYSKDDVEKIVNLYSKKNMVAAAASSIIPGPLGILGSIPDLIINFGNQMFMIYDLGCAYDKENFLNKDLLLDIPFAAFGGNTNLAQLQSNPSDLIDSPIDALKGKATGLGKSMVDRTLKKSIVQFVPIAGPVMMGIWSKMTTSKIAKSSQGFFDQEAVYVEHFKKDENEKIIADLQVQKIKALANLIECNDDINESQIEFIGPIIENAPIEQNRKNFLLEESLKTGSNFQLDYQLLKDYEEDENLIFELVVMARRSGFIDNLEKQYIHKIAQKLEIDQMMVDDLMK